MQSRVMGLTAFLLKAAMILLAIFAAAICVGLIRAGLASLSDTATPERSFMTGNFGSTIILFVAVIVNIYILKNMMSLISNIKKRFIFIRLNVKYLDNVCTLMLNLKLLVIVQAFFSIHEINSRFYEDLYGSWLGILMAFIFARVFEEGVRLNDEAQLTV
jgi:hypothetical protein